MTKKVIKNFVWKMSYENREYEELFAKIRGKLRNFQSGKR